MQDLTPLTGHLQQSILFLSQETCFNPTRRLISSKFPGLLYNNQWYIDSVIYKSFPGCRFDSSTQKNYNCSPDCRFYFLNERLVLNQHSSWCLSPTLCLFAQQCRHSYRKEEILIDLPTVRKDVFNTRVCFAQITRVLEAWRFVLQDLTAV